MDTYIQNMLAGKCFNKYKVYWEILRKITKC